MDKKVSVIICTHNPRENYLTRVLSALRLQTLPKDDWELLLIDNASAKPLATSWDLSWHPNGRHVREESLGLTPARLRGISESSGNLIVFVDDDNLLAPDYLAHAVTLSDTKPYLGAFGASITAEFEQKPPPTLGRYVRYFAVEEIARDYWSNLYDGSLSHPLGAGLCVRRSVAADYELKVQTDPRRRRLDRVGKSLGSNGDIDLAWCSIDMGMGTGRFHNLKLTHLISKHRLTEDYVVRLISESAASSVLLGFLRNRPQPVPSAKWIQQLKYWWHLARSRSLERRILRATRRAERQIRVELGQV